MSVKEFEDLRPLLFAIAYRLLGSVSEAEDAVQETWLRYQASTTPPESLKSFLAAVVTRVSIDVLRSARVRRESYVGFWLPEPLLTDADATSPPGPEQAAELAGRVYVHDRDELGDRATPLSGTQLQSCGRRYGLHGRVSAGLNGDVAGVPGA